MMNLSQQLDQRRVEVIAEFLELTKHLSCSRAADLAGVETSRMRDWRKGQCLRIGRRRIEQLQRCVERFRSAPPQAQAKQGIPRNWRPPAH